MELGTHTYSHFYCHEPGQTIDDFDADLRLAKKVAMPFVADLKSLVFPRNHFNAAYLEVCKSHGVLTVRSNPNIWFWNLATKETMVKKAIRSMDAYFAFKSKPTYRLNELPIHQTPFELPASRFFTPWSPKKILNTLKMRRILLEMTYAAKNKELYHLWWHPHNFGTYPEQCLEELEIILKHFQQLKKQYGFMSLNMNGVRDYLLEINEK
jgi:hypothetical protein